MNNRLIFYFLAVSLIVHLLALIALRHVPWQQALKRIKEPIAIDLIGTPKHGKVTAIPKYPEKQPDRGRQVVESKNKYKPGKIPMTTASAAPQAPARSSPPPAPKAPPAARPRALPKPSQAPTVTAKAAPQPPPAPRPPSKAAIPEQARPEAGVLSAVEPKTGSARQPVSPGKESQPQPGEGEAPRRLVQPTVEDLMRYAKVDPSIKRVDPDKGVSLSSEDLMYTSYLQGLKRRIELVWKYPETARTANQQGELLMSFTIAKSGKVESVELLKSSGYSTLDKAAQQAIMDASPFNPLPETWNKESFTITGTFVYRLYGLYVE
jgi:periplasmic protein TonB